MQLRGRADLTASQGVAAPAAASNAPLGTDADTTTPAPDLPAARNLRLNSLATLAAGGLTAVLGLVYWAAAARLYPPAEVGVASALVTSAVMLSTLSNLSLGPMYERFLPLAGRRARSLVLQGLGVTTTLALLLSLALIALGPREKLFTSWVATLSFPAIVIVLSVFALQDQAVSGLGVARWAAVKNIFHSASKLALVVVFAFVTATATAIVFSWAIPAAIAAAALMAAMLRRISRLPQSTLDPTLPPRRELWAYFGSSYGITVLNSVAPLALPLIVIANLGEEANAYFAIAWSMVAAIFYVIYMLVGPFVAEAARHPAEVPTLTRRFALLLTLVVAASSLFLVAAGPTVLGLIGAEYRDQGAPILHLVAVVLPFFAIETFYGAVARIRRRLRLALVAQIASTLVVMVGSLVYTRTHGIVAIGWVYLAAYGVVALLLTLPLARALRHLTRQQLPAPAGH